MPPDYRPKVDDKEPSYQKELIKNSINYIAGMMDTFAITEYERLLSVDFDKIDLSQDILKLKKTTK